MNGRAMHKTVSDTTGQLDRVISEMKIHAKRASDSPGYDEADVQTLKHHAEDMIEMGKYILNKIGIPRNTAPAKSPLHIERGSAFPVYMTLDEAKTILTVSRRIAGSQYRSRRKHFDRVAKELERATGLRSGEMYRDDMSGSIHFEEA